MSGQLIAEFRDPASAAGGPVAGQGQPATGRSTRSRPIRSRASPTSSTPPPSRIRDGHADLAGLASQRLRSACNGTAP